MAPYRPYESKLGIVTGGSRGIGEAVVRRLAAKGCNVLVVYTSDASTGPTDALIAELTAAHAVHMAAVQADLQKPFCVDILINNAGVASNERLGTIAAAEFERVYAVNVLAPLLLTQAVAPHLPHDRSGRIVSVSSVSSSIGYQSQSVYAGGKAALEAMTRVWSRELAERTTVNAVNPGPAWSDMYERVGPAFWDINQPYVDAAPLAAYHGQPAVLAMAGSDAHRFDALVRTAMNGRRPGFTAEIAGTIDMLCSEESGWTTGSVICANGGMKMSIA
ncbi:3-oxoacyl-(acyl-carrier-protein) reductase [Grosmannia clavigera kw1407]|uniref:3-oxoacyl-(Acyl-carrier-protein) reductase n=1 Tax=Grosmannia clavigera (strain kw1407 / UAMH 11150) TaxID=655863 RepID=F0XT08_GROCL|nr:3-oxoacyl-(acyl-carrier-protein) reductase [Grosmannia clavigera kw1407]EFW99125.1 3-oxoacyl-(acyl-carrier-protein) reductase [Grosmannia clavigera kw1407]